jgi:hypothetical protein
MTTEVKFGHFSIDLPSASRGYFSIFENLADFFGTEVQSEAFELLRAELKKRELKPRPNLDYESDYTEIDSSSADTIFEAATVVHALTLPEKRSEITEEQLAEIYRQLKAWKRPPRQKWKIGDVFSIPLLDNTYSFGQVVGTHITAKSPILALFEIKQETSDVTIDQLSAARVLSVWNSDDADLADWTYKVLFNADVIASPERVKNKKRSGGAAMDTLAHVYFGLVPYNILYKDDYYDEFLQPDIQRPDTILWLNEEEQRAYRRENFKIDE